MRRFYYRLRVFLVTLAIGLLVVNIWTRLAGYYSEIPVNLPQVESESPFVVLPREWKDMPRGGGSTGSAPDGSYANKSGGGGSGGCCTDNLCDPPCSSYIQKKQKPRRPSKE
ncbi:MAG TPA: hypothetical protein VF596_18480 [Pyrinomonadaceae bacterium]